MINRLAILGVWFSALCLFAIGVVMVASTTYWSEPFNYDMLVKQAGFGVLAIIMCIFFSKFNFEWLRNPRVIVTLYAVIIFLLAIKYVLPESFAPKINGERRWLRVPGFQFQPSEVAKLVVVVSLAAWYTSSRFVNRKLKGGWFGNKLWGFVYATMVPGIMVGMPVLLIFFEKDMGTASSFAAALFFVMFFGGTSRVLLTIVAVAGICLMGIYVQGDAHRMERIEAWKDLEGHRLGLGLQQYRAKLALAKGATAGSGLGGGLEKHGSLPFAHTDFIFASIGEELGIVGTVGTVSLYMIYCVCCLILAAHTRSTFGRIIAIGCSVVIFFPAMLNMYVVSGILPNTGLPLPFISQGGTNLMCSLFSLALLTSIYMRSTPEPVRCLIQDRADNKVPQIEI